MLAMDTKAAMASVELPPATPGDAKPRLGRRRASYSQLVMTPMEVKYEGFVGVDASPFGGSPGTAAVSADAQDSGRVGAAGLGA